MPLPREQKIKNVEKQRITNAVVKTEDEKIGTEVPMRVVACAGDPGLSEPWFFDILSRFLICMKEPVSYVPTNNRARKQFYLVRRPRHLWVDASGPPDITEANQHAGTRRKDFLGNINIGHPNGYSIDTIPQMDTEYTIGDNLMVRKVVPEYATDSNLFVSAFENTDFDNYYETAQGVQTGGAPYGVRVGKLGIGGSELADVMGWSNDYWTSHGGGITKAQLVSSGRGGTEWHQLKPLMNAAPRYGAPVNPKRAEDPELDVANNKSGDIIAEPESREIGTVGSNTFWIVLHYYRIDGFLKETHPSYATTIESLQGGKHRYQQAKGLKVKNPLTGRLQDTFELFSQKETEHKEKQSDGTIVKHKVTTGDSSYINKNLPFSFCEWEDTNQGNKQRSSRDDCMPLVIASPNNFPTPKERKLGSILYQPTYAVVVAAQTGATPPP